MRRRAVIEVEYTRESGRPVTEEEWQRHINLTGSGIKLRSVTVKEDGYA